MGMVLVKYLNVRLVDTLLLMLSNLKYGDLSKYGITKPKLGPLSLKIATGRSSVIDVGTIAKIKSGEIQVVKGPSRIQGNEVLFTDDKSYQFDAIVFATGYQSKVKKWLKDDFGLVGLDGFPIAKFPNHWKGENGLYFAGFARSGLAGISMDAKNIADDINMAYY
ncbi:probable indole-3-pyruvate monooxygenase YUCCA11 [Phoenix dactylifera]|uniref:indole-3-pyruvate monooxygenase n=1 Tax=Phoenix dactylifera TaxID=42345 RepID=A0A8B7CAT3_PHODC|nr:probable indole-3-pyruvate monooxygenase YUCCA11 [Phoenix dactylifera]